MRRIAWLLTLAAPLVAVVPDSMAVAEAPVTSRAVVFDRVWSLVDRHYWDATRLEARWDAARERYRDRALAAPDTHAFYAVLARMLDEIGDSHVFAVDPAQRAFEDARTGRTDPAALPGAFGFSTWQRDGAWRVFAVTADSPAARAGVRIGWRLIAVSGAPVAADWHPAIGERAMLEFRDEAGAPRTLALTAGPLADDAAWRATRLSDGVMLVTLDEFDRAAVPWLRAEIADAAPRALVLDLRENGGGEALAVARVAGVFFTAKRTLIERVARGRPLAVPVLGAGGRGGWYGPLAVLVGPRSASGAEALAALIDEAGRGMTVGERTAGALTGAALFDLPDGGQLSVAEFDIRTGSGRRLEGTGFVPRIRIPTDDAALRRGEDPVLAAALRALGSDGVERNRGLARSSPEP